MGNLKKEPIEEVKKDEEVKGGELKVEPKDISDIKVGASSPTYIKDDGYNLNVVKDYDGKVDVFYLSDKDPNYEYRFLNKKDSNLSTKTGNVLFQKGGWQLVPREHLLKIGVSVEFISPDGLYRVGDTILARMPKDLYAEKEAYKKKQADAPMEAILEAEKKGDSSVAGVGHANMQGLQTQKQLRM